ncbi:MAG: hypothetical protein M2R46_02063 [Verrucomicrobia subdivision 3 bacterium]|nr:hypothetical protein [Limisphaerales bacterium]
MSLFWRIFLIICLIFIVLVACTSWKMVAEL